MENWNLYRYLVLLAGFLGTVLFIQLTNTYRVQWDLTEEKRFSISEASKNILNDLEEPITIESYLAGELPSNFRRFEKALVDLLDQLAIYAGGNVQYSFLDPSQATSTQSRNDFYRSLIQKGLQPTNLTYSREGQRSEKLVFPGVVITYRGKEVAVNLLKGNRATQPEQMINESIEGLEFELISTIQSLNSSNRKRIGFIIGHEEPDTSNLAGFTNAILSRYDLFRLDIRDRNRPISGYDALIIGKPTQPFSQLEKYWLDQYIMNGGKLLAFVDALSVDVSQAEGEGTVAVPYTLNLEDLFFRYGVRINQDYVIDYSSGFFPGVLGNIGDQPRIELMPWPFFPVATNYGSHPLTKGLDATILKFASTIDTVKAAGVEKTPIILSSAYTNVLSPPVQVRFEDWVAGLNPDFFRQGPRAMGYLLEGRFTSLFKNRILPSGVDDSQFREDGMKSKMIIVSDGDFIRNDFNIQSGEPLAMGVDPYVRTTYANEELLMRALAYLVDEDGLTLVRNKEIKIRPLDRIRIGEERSYWIILNTLLPILLIVGFGLVKWALRRRRFAV